ncbi:MAG TPA: pantetheine-phosphate adenylyltransferase [Clostridiaceae bacterium]|nr:pantetheine-phosphate adenylyltransferase [Clostridiaceae bacterium]
MQKQRIWLFSGTFDPFTTGHLDIVNRAAQLCDKLIISVHSRSSKNTIFSTQERIEMILLATAHCDNIEVISFQGLIADFYDQVAANAIVRGIRNSSDLSYELPMAEINHRLNNKLETVFLLCRNELNHISSSNVRELGKLGNNLLNMIPECNLEFVQNRFAELR